MSLSSQQREDVGADRVELLLDLRLVRRDHLRRALLDRAFSLPSREDLLRLDRADDAQRRAARATTFLYATESRLRSSSAPLRSVGPLGAVATAFMYSTSALLAPAADDERRRLQPRCGAAGQVSWPRRVRDGRHTQGGLIESGLVRVLTTTLTATSIRTSSRGQTTSRTQRGPSAAARALFIIRRTGVEEQHAHGARLREQHVRDHRHKGHQGRRRLLHVYKGLGSRVLPRYGQRVRADPL